MRVFAVLLIILIACASELAAEEYTLNNPQIVLGLAQESGLDPNGFHLRYFLQRNRDGSSSYEHPEYNQQIIKHIRSDKKGVVFPGPELLEEYVDKTIATLKPKAEEFYKAMNDIALESLLVPRIVPCVGSETTKVPLKKAHEGKARDRINTDWLFIRDTSPKEKISEKFGNMVEEYRVIDNSSSSATLFANSLSIKCLPTRFRATGTHWYRHEGLDALRNYDTAPNGEGILSEEIEKNRAKYY